MIRENIFKDFLFLAYPPACEVCSKNLQRGESFLCTHCLFSLPRTDFNLHIDNPLTRLFWGRVQIETGTALFYYDKGGSVQKLVHRLKYKGGIALGKYLGQQLGHHIKSSGHYRRLDFIVPVPLHKDRLLKRGFNQSEIIGAGISTVIDVPQRANVLMRVSATQTQTRKRRFMRWENVESVFTVNVSEEIREKNVLLVDDVITTGSTLEACSSRLIEQGARVWVATVGVTV